MPELSPRTALAAAALKLQPDRRLVALVRDGHEAAFEEVVRRYRGPLVAFAARIVPTHRAEDVVQEALTRAHAAILRDGSELALKPWLYAIVRNRSLNDLRDEPVHEHLSEDHDGVLQPPAIAERKAELAGLVAGIQALPPSQRDALVRREFEGRGHAEIAEQMALSPGAVRQLIFRARATLREGAALVLPAPLLRALIGAAERQQQGLDAGLVAAGAGGAGLALKVGVAALLGGAALGGGLAIRDGDRSGASRLALAAPPDRSQPAARAHGDSAGVSGSARSQKPGGEDAREQGDADDERAGDDSGPGGDADHDDSGSGSMGSELGRDGDDSGGDEDEIEADDRSGSDGGSEDDHSGSGGDEPDEPEPVDEPDVPDEESSDSGSNSDSGSGSELKDALAEAG